MQGDRQVPALLRAKVTTEDNMSISKVVGLKVGYMVLDEFNRELGYATSKVFPSESTAKSYACGQEVIKVDVIRKFE